MLHGRIDDDLLPPRMVLYTNPGRVVCYRPESTFYAGDRHTNVFKGSQLGLKQVSITVTNTTWVNAICRELETRT